jgi:hypothetical protein
LLRWAKKIYGGIGNWKRPGESLFIGHVELDTRSLTRSLAFVSCSFRSSGRHMNIFRAFLVAPNDSATLGAHGQTSLIDQAKALNNSSWPAACAHSTLHRSWAFHGGKSTISNPWRAFPIRSPLPSSSKNPRSDIANQSNVFSSHWDWPGSLRSPGLA